MEPLRSHVRLLIHQILAEWGQKSNLLLFFPLFIKEETAESDSAPASGASDMFDQSRFLLRSRASISLSQQPTWLKVMLIDQVLIKYLIPSQTDYWPPWELYSIKKRQKIPTEKNQEDKRMKSTSVVSGFLAHPREPSKTNT